MPRTHRGRSPEGGHRMTMTAQPTVRSVAGHGDDVPWAGYGWSDGRRLRVALYSHDALGLGHVRRNLAIARALTTLDPAPDVLLLTGAPEAVTVHRPAHVDLVSLPALSNNADGVYSARLLSVDEPHIRHMRRSILTAALCSFLPDV